MSDSNTDRLKPAESMRADKHAYALVSALATDLKDDLPPGFAALICGRARNRDCGFFAVELPAFVGDLVSDGSWRDQPSFKGFDAQWNSRAIEAAYLVGSFLKKYPFRESKKFTDAYRTSQARRAFKRANRWCRRMNRLGLQRDVSGANKDHAILSEARRVIAGILPEFRWEEAVKRSYFGPGVNVGVGWAETDAQCKIYLDKTLTRPLAQKMDFAAQLVPAYLYYEGFRTARELEYSPAYRPGDLEDPRSARYSFLVALGLWRSESGDRSHVVAGSKYALAPKDAKTFRSIAAEPALNSFLQNGIGKWMRDILAAFSAQLNCADQNRNRALAYAGSSTGWLATIDLSSASDTVCWWLAKALLPKSWFSAMRLIRSPRIEIEGKQERVHMFSSMGNGYTFPLETLVFYALSVAAIRIADPTADCSPNEGGPGANREPSVYGDDIIVTSEDAPVVLKALRDFGFWPNARKSFYRGPFRESCGHDYRDGNYIRPIFLRRPLEWSFDAISLINHLSNPAGFGWYTTRYGRYFTTFCECLVGLCRSYPPIPIGPVGDTHVVTHVRAPMQLVRSVGATHMHSVSDEACTRQTTTEYFYPLRVVARKFADWEDIAVYLKSLLAQGFDDKAVDKSSLYTRVKRGEVTVRLPRRDSGTPILGWEEGTAEFRDTFTHYWKVLRGIRWYNPAAKKPRRADR